MGKILEMDFFSISFYKIKDFLKRNSRDLQSDLGSLNLTVYDLIIDDKNLEIKLNYSQPWLKNTKR